MKEVPLPNFVSVSVSELNELREKAAFLAALKSAGVEDWARYSKALWLFKNDPDIQDIKLGKNL